MIRFEINEFPFALTNDQFNTITTIIDGAGWDLDYDVVEGDSEGIVWLWQHPHPGAGEALGNPTRHWIDPDGEVSLSEDVDWDWNEQGVGAPTPSETDKE